jgi:hypothetical protein
LTTTQKYAKLASSINYKGTHMNSKTISNIIVLVVFAISATAFQFAGFEVSRAQASTGDCSENASLTAPQVIPGTVAPGSINPFQIQIYDSGSTRFYHGSYFQLVQKTSLNVDPPYGHLASGMYPGDTQTINFKLIAPEVPGTYTVTFQMRHNAGASYLLADGSECGVTPTQDTYFGNSVSMTFTVVGPQPQQENCANAGLYLEGAVVDNGMASGIATARVTNKSTTCTYPIGFASYKMYVIENPQGSDPSWLTTQTLFDSKVFSIAPGQTIDTNQIRVSVPNCRYQIDLFEGSVQTPPWYGFSQGHYLMDFEWGNKPVCTDGNPDPNPNPDPDPKHDGVITIMSNVPSTWTITGTENFSGTGTYASYTADPGTYSVTSVPATITVNGVQYELVGVTPPSQTVESAGSSVFQITYNQVITVGTPTITLAGNSTCAQINLAWNDNSNNETGFHVYRSEQENGGNVNTYARIATLGAGVTSYIDRPALSKSYYYIVASYMTSPERFSASQPFHSAFNAPCTANIQGTIAITAINGSTNFNLNNIKDNDTLTIQMLVDNYGPAEGYITRVTNQMSTNLVNPRNFSVTGPNAQIGHPPVTGVHPNITFNVSGRKEVGGLKWQIKFDATVDIPDGQTMQDFSNCATVYYFDDAGNKSERFCLTQTLAKSTKTGGTKFNEVAP